MHSYPVGSLALLRSPKVSQLSISKEKLVSATSCGDWARENKASHGSPHFTFKMKVVSQPLATLTARCSSPSRLIGSDLPSPIAPPNSPSGERDASVVVISLTLLGSHP